MSPLGSLPIVPASYLLLAIARSGALCRMPVDGSPVGTCFALCSFVVAPFMGPCSFESSNFEFRLAFIVRVELFEFPPSAQPLGPGRDCTVQYMYYFETTRCGCGRSTSAFSLTLPSLYRPTEHGRPSLYTSTPLPPLPDRDPTHPHHYFRPLPLPLPLTIHF